MSERIRSLIDEAVAIAKARGLSQAKLAENAGLSAVGLSKAKHRGDIRASLLEALGDQLDLELAFIPRRSKEKAAEAIKAGTFFRVSNKPARKD
jgi:transcriptional regulator with XRE-family HTH domain